MQTSQTTNKNGQPIQHLDINANIKRYLELVFFISLNIVSAAFCITISIFYFIWFFLRSVYFIRVWFFHFVFGFWIFHWRLFVRSAKARMHSIHSRYRPILLHFVDYYYYNVLKFKHIAPYKPQLVCQWNEN